jgi:arylsulfatase
MTKEINVSKKRNVVFILSDQLRADCVACYGNPIIKTPHIDALAAGGTRFANAFSQHPQCVPSRAAILTGRYPHVNGAISNFTATGPHELTMPEFFRDEGYRTIAVGKLHQFDQKEQAGFSDTMMSGGQHSGATSPECMRDDYRNWLKANGYWEAAEKAYAIHGTDEYWDAFQANVNPIPAKAYVDSWVGDRAVDFIREHANTGTGEGSHSGDPFFMFVGFPNPHVPFDAPEPYASLYDPDTVPVPQTFGLSLDDKPPQHLGYKRNGRRVNYDEMTEEKLRRAIAYYYGSITLVDDQVGKIVTALEDGGLLEETIIVFVSDHGELLGHYGMLIKSIDQYPMLYDVGLKVPCIVRLPRDGSPSQTGVVERPIELIDLFPTVIDAAGFDVPTEVQGYSLVQSTRDGMAPDREYIFAETGAVKMIRGDKYKLVHYPRQEYGELYDIETDPDEIYNLYVDTRFRAVRDRMTADLLDRLISTEGSLHGESMRGPAYWKTMHRLPFDG